MNATITAAVDIARVAQRNWDLSKTIPQADLDTLIYAAQQSPKKAMETHYALHVFTDKTKIRQIYDQTKKFLVAPTDATEPPDDMFEMRDGQPWQNDEKYSVKNSQVLANAMFVFTEDRGTAKGGTHYMAKEGGEYNALTVYEEQIDFSIGIAVGNLTLSAAMLGYKTGICSALECDNIANILSNGQSTPGSKDIMNPKLIIGIGYPNEGVDRTWHHETKNSELGFDASDRGPLNELFKFPSFDGTGDGTDLYINGVKQ